MLTGKKGCKYHHNSNGNLILRARIFITKFFLVLPQFVFSAIKTYHWKITKNDKYWSRWSIHPYPTFFFIGHKKRKILTQMKHLFLGFLFFGLVFFTNGQISLEPLKIRRAICRETKLWEMVTKIRIYMIILEKFGLWDYKRIIFCKKKVEKFGLSSQSTLGFNVWNLLMIPLLIELSLLCVWYLICFT